MTFTIIPYKPLSGHWETLSSRLTQTCWMRSKPCWTINKSKNRSFWTANWVRNRCPHCELCKSLSTATGVRLACASFTAVAVLTGNHVTMGDVVFILRDQNLENRSCSTEGITMEQYFPAMHAIAAFINSPVLRSQQKRVVLDVKLKRHEQPESSPYVLDLDTLQFLDLLLWDNSHYLDFMRTKKETKKSPEVANTPRNCKITTHCVPNYPNRRWPGKTVSAQWEAAMMNMQLQGPSCWSSVLWVL